MTIINMSLAGHRSESCIKVCRLVMPSDMECQNKLEQHQERKQ